MFSRKKQSLLVSRPRPPSFAEVVEDVGAANDDDCVFHFIESLSEDSTTTDENESSKPVHEPNVSDHDLREDEQKSSEVETAYNQARLFIDMMEELKLAPPSLQNLYEHLKIGNHKLQDSIRSLQQNVDELKQLGSDVTVADSK